MTPADWTTTAIVAALWLSVGIPLAWRTVRAMRHDARMRAWEATWPQQDAEAAARRAGRTGT